MIGTAISRALAARGDTPVRLIRPVSRGSGIYWDPKTGQIDKDGLNGIDAVVHLAGESILGLWTPAHKRRVLDSRVRGTSLISSTIAALPNPPRVLVSASGINYYGNRPGSEPIDESAPQGQGFLAEVAGRWEAAAAPAREAGIRVVHIRTGLVLARNEGTLKYAVPVFYMGLGGRLGTGRQYWSWIALADVVRSYLHALDQPLAGPVNATAPEPVTNAEFTRVLAEVVHRPAFMAVPEFVLGLGGDLAKELILSGARVVPRKLLESGFRFRFTELRAALQAILAGEDGS